MRKAPDFSWMNYLKYLVYDFVIVLGFENIGENTFILHRR